MSDKPQVPKQPQPRKPNPTEPSTKALTDVATAYLELLESQQSAVAQWEQLAAAALETRSLSAKSGYDELVAASETLVLQALQAQARSQTELNRMLFLIINLLIERVVAMEEERG